MTDFNYPQPQSAQADPTFEQSSMLQSFDASLSEIWSPQAPGFGQVSPQPQDFCQQAPQGRHFSMPQNVSPMHHPLIREASNQSNPMALNNTHFNSSQQKQQQQQQHQHQHQQHQHQQRPFTGAHSVPGRSTTAFQPLNDGLHRFEQESDTPYFYRDAFNNIASSPTQPVPFAFPTYRTVPPPSESIVSDDRHHFTNDSAYVSAHTRSVISAGAQFDTGSLPDLFNSNLRTETQDSVETAKPSVSSSGKKSRKRSKPSSSWQCTTCSTTLKCQSDFNKHMLIHLKNFFCREPRCPRPDKGFRTKNDLERHQKSVHKLDTGIRKSYRCAGQRCDKPDKIWPRFDNFKQHVLVLHKDEHGKDEDKMKDIFRRSVILLEPKQEVPPGSMDLDVATAGAGSHLEAPIPQGVGMLSGNTVTPENLLKSAPFGDKVDLGTEAEDPFTIGVSVDMAPPAFGDFQNQFTPQSEIDGGLTGVASFGATSFSSPDPATTQWSEQPSSVQQAGSHRSSSRATVRSQDFSTAALESGMFTSESQVDSASPVKLTQPHSAMSLESVARDLGYTNPEFMTKLRSLVEDEERAKSCSHDQQSPSAVDTTVRADGPVICSKCNKKLARSCDLNKHMKRHTRPYGCTHPRCHKTFGSKNDWKRHEKSQHFLQELWRCSIETAGTLDGKCGTTVFHPDTFVEHLKSAHGVEDARELERHRTQSRIGRSGHTRFWCGFCMRIIPVARRPNHAAASEERFDHVDAHYKEGKKIDDWLCVETKKLKGEDLEESRKLTESNGSRAGAFGRHSASTSGLRSFGRSGSSASSRTGTMIPTSTPMTAATPDGQARDGDMGTDLEFSEGIYCCKCYLGPYNINHASCDSDINCNHEFCGGCSDKPF